VSWAGAACAFPHSGCMSMSEFYDPKEMNEPRRARVGQVVTSSEILAKALTHE